MINEDDLDALAPGFRGVWLDEEWLADLSGGDFEDLANAMRKAYNAGYEQALKDT